MKPYEPIPLIPVSTEGLDDIAEALLNNTPPSGSNPEQGHLNISARINPREYIRVGINGLYGKPVVISKFELIGMNKLNYEESHFKLGENGLYMPTPRIFTTHFNNVLRAVQGRGKLYDVAGNEINGKELEDIYKHLTKAHIAIYGSQPGAWTWLNGKFVEGTGANGLDLETVIGINGTALVTKKEPLQPCLFEDKFAELDFNSQGLATKLAASQNYEQGKNMKFWFPRKNCVAGFFAISGGAGLYCSGDPDSRDDALGVFASAEGASVA